MAILIAISSIFAFAGAARFLRVQGWLRVCPVCAGVAGTWIWMYAALAFGAVSGAEYRTVTALLMGGSVVGITLQLEKRLPKNRASALWNVAAASLGFTAAYFLIFRRPLSALAAMGALAGLFFLFFRWNRAAHPNESARALKEKMKNCC